MQVTGNRKFLVVVYRAVNSRSVMRNNFDLLSEIDKKTAANMA
jgi:hypothetical protein